MNTSYNDKLRDEVIEAYAGQVTSLSFWSGQ